MKLLLDEHYAPDIAVQLRELGHDAVAVQEVSALRGLSDPELFAEAQRREWALVTENVADYLPLDRLLREGGHPPVSSLVWWLRLVR